MDNYKMSVLSYNFLNLVQALQVLFFAYQNSLPYMWKDKVIVYIFEVLNYVQFDKVLTSDDTAVKMSVFYICIITIAAVYLCIVIISSYYDNKDKHNKALFKYAVKLCVFLLVLHNTIFTIPMLQSMFNMLICIQNSNYAREVDICYKGISIMNVVFSCFGVLLLILEFIPFNLFLNEMNPNSKSPTASFNINQNFLWLLIKILLPLFYCMDPSTQYRQYLVIGGIVFLLANLIFFRLNYPPLYNPLVTRLTLWIDSTLFYSYLILLVQIVSIPL